MSRRGTLLALVVGALLVGATLSLIAGAIGGMAGKELRDIGFLMTLTIVATVLLSLLADRFLSGRSLKLKFVVVSLLGLIIGLVNLGVLVLSMSVSHHDATLVAISLIYALAAGTGAALAVARASSSSVARVTAVARRLGEDDLAARVGSIDAGAELDTLALTLDEMADRLQSSIDRERNAERQRSDLITAVSHDLRTPLANMQAMVEAIDEGVVADGPTMRRYAAHMRQSVESLSTLVDDLFELVQLDAGAIAAETERARLDDVMESALAACRPEATEKGLRLEAAYDSASDWNCSPRLVRVMQNLLQNAIRHTPADGTVRVEAISHGEQVELAVADSGDGIAAADIDLVFEPFWRGDAARTSPGSGLGLALAKRIVESLGGTISVDDRADGARFAVLLPREPQPSG